MKLKEIKNYFIKPKINSYKKIEMEKKAELEALLDVLYKAHHSEDDYNYSSWFDIKQYLDRKIEQYLNKNMWKYFTNKNYYNSNDNIDWIIKTILEKKFEEKYNKFFTKESEEYIKKEIDWLSMYYIKETKPFEKFLTEYFEKNKVDIVCNLRKVIDTDKFTETLSERVWDEIGDMVQEKLKSCSY